MGAEPFRAWRGRKFQAFRQTAVPPGDGAYPRKAEDMSADDIDGFVRGFHAGQCMGRQEPADRRPPGLAADQRTYPASRCALMTRTNTVSIPATYRYNAMYPAAPLSITSSRMSSPQ